jgi:hypothetical protein
MSISFRLLTGRRLKTRKYGGTAAQAAVDRSAEMSATPIRGVGAQRLATLLEDSACASSALARSLRGMFQLGVLDICCCNALQRTATSMRCILERASAMQQGLVCHYSAFELVKNSFFTQSLLPQSTKMLEAGSDRASSAGCNACRL